MMRQARKDCSRFLAKHAAVLWDSDRHQAWCIIADRTKMRDEQFLDDFIKCRSGKLKRGLLTFTDLQQTAIARWARQPYLTNQEMLEALHDAGHTRTTQEHVRTLRHRLLLKRKRRVTKNLTQTATPIR